MLSEFVHAAIERTYIAFQRPTPPRVIDGCTHCTTPAERARLLAAPLRTLSAETLGRYSFKAVSTFGTVADFRFFWPRLVELALRGELATDFEVIWGKLALADWQTWPEAERAAVLDLADVLSRDLAATSLDPELVDSRICALGRLGPAIEPYLEPLLAATQAGVHNRAGFWVENADAVARGRLANGYWDRESPNYDRLVAWCQLHVGELRAAAEYG